MYLCQPPSTLLTALRDAWPQESKPDNESTEEYARYRWDVFEWCMRNWGRIEFDRAQTVFFERARDEVARNTRLVPSILEALATLHRKPEVREFVAWCVSELARVEKGGTATVTDRVPRALALDVALTMFFLGVPHEELEKSGFLAMLDTEVSQIAPSRASLLRNLRVNLGRNPPFPRPEWALSVVGESLFRGRGAGMHRSGGTAFYRALRDVYENPSDPEKRRLLQGSLAAFLAAVEDLAAYLPIPCLTSWYEAGGVVREWLRIPATSDDARFLPRGFDSFTEMLDPNRKWCGEFNAAFQPSVSESAQSSTRASDPSVQSWKKQRLEGRSQLSGRLRQTASNAAC